MEEVKLRFSSVDAALNGGTSLPPLHVREFFLQLRLLCESIALGCLVAHGEITTTRLTSKLRKEWAADRIINQLEQLHPDFYPHPVIFKITPPSSEDPGSFQAIRKGADF